MNPIKMTPGEAMLMANIRSLAAIRHWNLEKTIKKVKRILAILELANGDATPETSAHAEDKTVKAFEQILKEIQAPPSADNPT